MVHTNTHTRREWGGWGEGMSSQHARTHSLTPSHTHTHCGVFLQTCQTRKAAFDRAESRVNRSKFLCWKQTVNQQEAAAAGQYGGVTPQSAVWQQHSAEGGAQHLQAVFQALLFVLHHHKERIKNNPKKVTKEANNSKMWGRVGASAAALTAGTLFKTFSQTASEGTVRFTVAVLSKTPQ